MIKTIFTLIYLSSSMSFTFAQVVAQNPDDWFEGKTKIENPLELPDPFRLPMKKMTAETPPGFFKNESGAYSNIEDIVIKSVNDIKVVGILVGKERRALVKVGDSKVLTMKEGMSVGIDKVELKAILPGGVIFVEKIVNVYGQEEYLETVIPISK